MNPDSDPADDSEEEVLKCSKCGSVDGAIQIQPYRRRELRWEKPWSNELLPPEPDIFICSNCPYYQCQTCERSMTVDEPGVTACCCGASDVCMGCREKNLLPPPIRCHHCSNPAEIAICKLPACAERARRYFEENADICSFCGVTRRCTHTMWNIGMDADPYRNKTSALCCYAAGPEAAYCGKWICEGCILKCSLVIGDDDGQWAGFCREHYDLEYPNRNPKSDRLRKLEEFIAECEEK